MPQFFANNPLVKRDATFEKLQTYLGDAANRTSLGLNENLTNKIKLLRQNVEEFKITLLIVDKGGKQIYESKPLDEWNLVVKYKFFDTRERESEPIPLKQLKLRSEDLSATLVKEFDTRIRLTYGFSETENSNSTQLKKLILYLILNALINEEIDFSKFGSMTTENFSFNVNNNLMPFLKNVLDREIDWKDKTSTSEKDLVKEAITQMVISLNSLVENFKSKLTESIYKIEESVAKAKKDISQSLISANTGIAVNNVEGNFGGGLLVSAITGSGKKGNRTSLAIFANGLGSVGAADTSHVKQPFLAGFQLNMQIAERDQFSFLGSASVNERKLSGQSVFFEVGAGYQRRTYSDLIWGFGLFYQHINQKVMPADTSKTTPFEIKSLLTFGLTLRTISNTSPVIFIGGSVQKEFTPVIQISYPINFGRP